MKKNVRQFKTTLIGFILFICGIVYVGIPSLSLGTYEINHWYSGIGVLGGIAFIFAPDRVLEILFGFLKSKTK